MSPGWWQWPLTLAFVGNRSNQHGALLPSYLHPLHTCLLFCDSEGTFSVPIKDSLLFFFPLKFTYDINALLTDHPGGPRRQPRHPAPSPKFAAASEPLALTPVGWARRPRARGLSQFRMMERLVPSMNSTRTRVHCPCEPVLPKTLVTLASLMGCTRLVSVMAARRRSGEELLL